MGMLIAWVERRGEDGYLCLLETTASSRRLSPKSFPGPGGPTRSPRSARSTGSARGGALVVHSLNARRRIPVAFRLLWRPPNARRAPRTPTGPQARVGTGHALKEVTGSGLLHPKYIVFDAHHTAGWFTKTVARLGLWCGSVRSIRGRSSSGAVEGGASPKWPGSCLSEVAQAPRDARRGHKRLRRSQVRLLLAVGREQKPSRQPRVHRHQRPGSGPRYGSRAQGEPLLVRRDAFFRDTKQFAGLEACQCRVDQAMVRHVVGLVLLAFSSFFRRCAAVQARAWALSRSAGDWRCCEMANLHPRR
jgi:hypothetical protein